MSPSDAQLAARQGSQSVMVVVVAAMATDLARCSPRYVPSVERTPKYRSNPVKADQCIVASAIIKTDRVGNFSFT